MQHQLRARRAAATHRIGCRRLVTASRQPRSLAGGVDAAQLQRNCDETAHAQHQDHGQRRDRERRLDRGATVVCTQTLVLSALVMMLVSALTMESPVTTV